MKVEQQYDRSGRSGAGRNPWPIVEERPLILPVQRIGKSGPHVEWHFAFGEPVGALRVLMRNRIHLRGIRTARFAMREVFGQDWIVVALDGGKCDSLFKGFARFHNLKIQMLNASHLTQVFQPVKQATFHGANAAPEGNGDFFERMIHIEAQIDNLALFVWQCVEMFLE